MGRSHLFQRLKEYVWAWHLRLERPLGAGVHGIIFSAISQSQVRFSALKALENRAAYIRERDAYLRLQQLEVFSVLGCNIPILLGFDDELSIIEMTIVSRPFVLDFAGSYLDHAPEFSEEVLADWKTEKMDQFGSQWHRVESILRHPEHNFGIYMLDVNPGNISFAN